jgi:hypothetical protein
MWIAGNVRGVCAWRSASHARSEADVPGCVGCVRKMDGGLSPQTPRVDPGPLLRQAHLAHQLGKPWVGTNGVE